MQSHQLKNQQPVFYQTKYRARPLQPVQQQEQFYSVSSNMSQLLLVSLSGLTASSHHPLAFLVFAKLKKHHKPMMPILPILPTREYSSRLEVRYPNIGSRPWRLTSNGTRKLVTNNKTKDILNIQKVQGLFKL